MPHPPPAADQPVVGSPRVLRPVRRLLHQGIVTMIALTSPVFAVLYWLAIPRGSWPVVLAVHILVGVLCTAMACGYATASIRLTPNSIRERGFFGRSRSYSDRELTSILLLETYRHSALDSQPQLFVCGHDERTLVRMRGAFWRREDMDAVIGTLDLPVRVVDDTVTKAQLRSTRPELLYWFERLPPSRRPGKSGESGARGDRGDAQRAAARG